MTTLAATGSPSHSLAQLLKAAADELRLSILKVLATDSFGVLELAQIFDIKQSGMSHHLKVLAAVNLVDSRREGNSIFYRRCIISPSDLFVDVKKTLFKQIDECPIEDAHKTRLSTIWQERANTSQRFFVENAEKFADQQDLIANFDVYQRQVTEMVRISNLKNTHHALEMGPGQGEFLTTLNALFDDVVAIDLSQEMLAKAQQTVDGAELAHVRLILGDTTQLTDFPNYFQLAVANMVLHHTPSPARFIQDVAQSLAAGGVFIVTELCLHHQNWTHEACGDVWLGFAPEDLTAWADEAGLSAGQSVYFALRNGFQIQIQQFIKTPA